MLFFCHRYPAYMHTDFSFQKIYHRNLLSASAAKEVLEWADQMCLTNGLTPVETEGGAHFSLMLIEGGTPWLHFSGRGHFSPHSSANYATVTQLLSERYPVLDFQGRDGGPYVLRRFDDREVTARYAVYGDTGRFDSVAAAELWNPVFAPWEEVLAPGLSAEQFYQLLPAPRHPESPVPTVMTDYFDLPEHFNTLFGWHRELNYACIEFAPDGPNGRGDFYEPEAGDYVDKDRDLRIYVRHYVHPEGNARYAPLD